MLDAFADFDGFADDFVADAAGVLRWPLCSVSECSMKKSQASRIESVTYPPGTKCVKIRTADTAVRNLDIDIILSPRLRLKLLPNHVAVDGVFVEAHPSFELVWHGHIGCF